MRFLALVVVLAISGCCVSEETKQLAQGIHLYQESQAVIVRKLADYAHDGGALTDSEYASVTGGQDALTGAARNLSEILGKPKSPVEVDSW